MVSVSQHGSSWTFVCHITTLVTQSTDTLSVLRWSPAGQSIPPLQSFVSSVEAFGNMSFSPHPRVSLYSLISLHEFFLFVTLDIFAILNPFANTSSQEFFIAFSSLDLSAVLYSLPPRYTPLLIGSPSIWLMLHLCYSMLLLVNRC